MNLENIRTSIQRKSLNGKGKESDFRVLYQNFSLVRELVNILNEISGRNTNSPLEMAKNATGNKSENTVSRDLVSWISRMIQHPSSSRRDQGSTGRLLQPLNGRWLRFTWGCEHRVVWSAIFTTQCDLKDSDHFAYLSEMKVELLFSRVLID